MKRPAYVSRPGDHPPSRNGKRRKAVRKLKAPPAVLVRRGYCGINEAFPERSRTTMPVPVESEEAVAFFDWVRAMKIDFIIHVPNEGKRSLRAGHQLKREGMQPGASDYIVLMPSGGFSGMVLELKRLSEDPGDTQTAWLRRRREHGYHAVVAWGALGAIDAVKTYLCIR